jgi:Abnormal spindle-like microcephaly-assoc'd, ASPM-SPD-2-Hydin
VQDFILRWDGMRSRAISILIVSFLLTLCNLTLPTAAYPLSSTSTAGQLVVTPGSVSFGNVALGASQTQPIVLTNSGGSSLTITQASVNNSAFSVSGLTYPLTLAAGKSASCIVTFAPQSGGATSGSVVISFQPSYNKRKWRNATYATSTVPVSGSGITAGLLVASPQNLSFGNVQVGSSQTLPESLSNSGGSNLTISQATLIGTGFTLTGLTLPTTLVPGQSVAFSLTFTPQSSATVSGSLSITSNGSNSNLAIGITGTGVLTPGTLNANPSGLSFGVVQVGNNQSLPVTLANSGGSSVTISQANLSSSSFNVNGLTLPLTLNVGQSTAFNVVFSPQGAGSLTGSLAVVSNASNSALNIALSGSGVTPAILNANPTSLSFGSVATGSSQTLSETLTNSGGSTLTISQITTTGTGFSFSGVNPPITLNPGQNFTFNATFTPTTTGSASGTLSITSNASNPSLSLALSGSGVTTGVLAVSPASLSFGSVTVGKSVSQTGTLTASNAPVTVSSIWANSSEFTVSGISVPTTIAAGSTATFNVVFAPQASGTASASLGFVSNASNTPTLQTLSGTGVAPVQHSVALTWNPSTSSNVVGYNLYRGSVSGGPYTKLNSALDPGTSDTDTAVQSGQTYYYVVTAVDSSGNESLFSNQVLATIP